MTDRSDRLTEQIWTYIHGELDPDAARDLLARAGDDPEVARRIEQTRRMEAFLTTSLKTTPRTIDDLVAGLENEPEMEVDAKRPLIAFPSWARTAQLAAACAAALFVVYVAVPRGPVQWSSTQIVLLESTRADHDPSLPATQLDIPGIERACADLRDRIEDAYLAVRREEDAAWRMRLSVTEFAGGKFEIQVAGETRDQPPRAMEASRVYDDVTGLQVDREALVVHVAGQLQNPPWP